MDEINIEGIDRASLIAELHNGTGPLGLGWLHARPPMTAEEVAEQLGERLQEKEIYLDYFNGRPLKVAIGETTMTTRLYDRDAGHGRAAEIVAALRK
jgi:hypothetical protein